MTNAELKALLQQENDEVDALTTDILALVAKIGDRPDVPSDISDLAKSLADKLAVAKTDAETV